MPTIKKSPLVIGIALIVLSGLAWQNSYLLTGQIPPGKCVHKTTNGEMVISNSDARELFKSLALEKEPLDAASLACGYWPRIPAAESALTKTGLTKNANWLVAEIEAVFGPQSKGGYAPGGVTSGHIKGSAHYEGRAIDFFFRPHTKPKNRLAGWQLAIWASVYADDLGISTIIFDDKIWTRNNSGSGWREYVHPSGDRTNPILRHLDHVHIDVD